MQVYPDGIRHIRADKRVNEWKTPGKKTIVRCAVNQRQVVIALTGGELVYFEMDPVKKKKNFCLFALVYILYSHSTLVFLQQMDLFLTDRTDLNGISEWGEGVVALLGKEAQKSSRNGYKIVPKIICMYLHTGVACIWTLVFLPF